MFRLLTSLISALFSGLRSRRDLVLENLALRQQLSTVLQKHQPRIRPADRLFWVLLRRFWSKWADAVIIVKPKTVVAWHRAGFALYWRWLSRSGRRPGRPSLDRQIRDLVRRMAAENGWRATRIHGETATFRLLYAWFAIGHARRQVLHWGITEFPSASWVVQQLREAFSFDISDFLQLKGSLQGSGFR